MNAVNILNQINHSEQEKPKFHSVSQLEVTPSVAEHHVIHNKIQIFWFNDMQRCNKITKSCFNDTTYSPEKTYFIQMEAS